MITTIAWANNLLKCFPPAIVALDLLTHPMLGAILLMFGSILTVSWYGWLHLLAFFPIWFLFGFFWGVAPLIGMFKIVNAFTPIQFVATAILQVLWVVALRYLLEFLGMLELFPYYIIVGVHTGLLMNANDLRAERLEYSKNKKL